MCDECEQWWIRESIADRTRDPFSRQRDPHHAWQMNPSFRAFMDILWAGGGGNSDEWSWKPNQVVDLDFWVKKGKIIVKKGEVPHFSSP